MPPTGRMVGRRTGWERRAGQRCCQNVWMQVPVSGLRSLGSSGSIWSIGSSGSILSVGSLASAFSGGLAGLGVLDRLGCQRRLDLVGPFPLVDPGVAVDTARPNALPPTAIAGLWLTPNHMPEGTRYSIGTSAVAASG